jgi:hypothetical protein
MKKLLVLLLVGVMALGFGVPALANGTINLIADGGSDGEHIDVGDLSVTFDGTNLNIDYTTVGGWEMDETHLNVDTDWPAKHSPGKYTYKHEDLGWVTTDSYSHPATYDETYCIVAHAVVRLQTGEEPLLDEYGEPVLDEYGEPIMVPVYRYESAWAQMEETASNMAIGHGKNWATGFVVTTPEEPVE